MNFKGTILLINTIVIVFSYIFLITQKIKLQLLQNIENVLFMIKLIDNLILKLSEKNIQ